MSQQRQRRIQLPIVGAALLCLLAAVYLITWKRFSKPKGSIPIVKHTVKTSPAETLKYWTADKMRDAKGVDLPNVDAFERGKEHPRHP